MRDVNYGWLMRYIHMNGASMFFLIVYIHMFRGLYYGSYKYPREMLWMLGVVILLLMMATAFMGYVLPWGQMSYWGATVITNLFSAIPLVGEQIVTLLWGGFTVDNPTLNRFFSLHYLLPFVHRRAWSCLHLDGAASARLEQSARHRPARARRTRSRSTRTTRSRTCSGCACSCSSSRSSCSIAPNFLGDPDNYIPANPMVTPTAHRAGMVLPAVLRDPALGHLRFARHPGKLLGVMLLFGAIMVLFVVPWLDTSPVRSARFRPIYRMVSWFLVDRRDRARLCRQPAAAGLDRHDRPDRHAYYFISTS